MHYSISLQGMHCSGCKNLITLSFEDEGFAKIHVDEQAQSASFDSNEDVSTIDTKLTKLFKELKDYSYSNLKIIP